MTVHTKSLFYYTPAITISNNALDFSEGGPNIEGTLAIGAKSPANTAKEIEAVLNAGGALTYTVTFDRLTNLVTISATGVFELNVLSGPRSGTSIYTDIGFTTNRSGASSYTGDTSFTEEFRPQFWLQDYVDPTKWTEAVKANVNEAASGRLETFSFGKKSFYQLRATFITNRDQGVDSPIDTDATAVESVENFMAFIIDKGPLEFMPDRGSPAAFDQVQLDSTALNSKGVGFKLRELTGQGLADYHDTGVLVFRKLGIT